MFNKNKNALRMKTDSFKSISIGLLSPEMILERSFGEVIKPETINYRSYKPEKDGLFCEKIFGPTKDWECHCGKYKGIRYKGIVCDRCGVEVTRKSVRRERPGHITLAVPVVHIWYLRSIPSKISYILGYTTKQLEQIVYFEKFVVINPGESGLKKGDLVDEDQFVELETKYGFDAVPAEKQDEDIYFYAEMGGEAVSQLLKMIDITAEIDRLSAFMKAKGSSIAKKEEALKRLKVLKKFDIRVEKMLYNKPEWMIMSILPVIPPELRPLVPLDGGRFAASDLNDLYRRVIIRNNRLKQLMEIKAPDVILRNEKRMLQEAVDALLDNGRIKSAVRSGTRRPLKSLSDALKGKTGRFRQNLLGKRVDYSGRSVIVVGPEIQLHECGIPKDMALELFKPLILNQLIIRGISRTPRSAKLLVERKASEVYYVLEETVKNHPVLLNRAPTLHRLGIQAFQPVLIEGKAIRLHPLVCSAFNADFDGDQMAVHLPLSPEAKLESWILMLSSHNILHPATGKPIAIPSQDMILGIYYLTRDRSGEIGEGKRIFSFDEAYLGYENKELSLHTIVDYFNDGEWIAKTTVGRILFNSILPKGMPYYNQTLGKKDVLRIIGTCYKDCGNYQTVKFLDKLKTLGFEQAFFSGLSIAISDIHIPSNKLDIIGKADKEVKQIQDKFDKHIITEGERYNKVIDVWTHATNEVAHSMFNELESDDQGFNALFMMADSGARGSQDQIKQLAGMRGLMAKPKKSMTGASGEIIENPIKSNFKEGLSVFEYFISTHGARKGLADTALKTADAGYLTRRLVDVAQDVTITIDDCKTSRGKMMIDLKEGEEIIEPLHERIFGRYTLEDVIDPITGKKYAKANTIIDEEISIQIKNSNINQVLVRSVLSCEAERGVCAMCYGLNLATWRASIAGDAVGVVAAQSIGEPGTQLTLRTFHIGGTASRILEQSFKAAKSDGVIKFSKNLQIVKVKSGNNKFVNVASVRNGRIDLLDVKENIINSWDVPYGAFVEVKDGKKIKTGDVLFSWDPYTDVILARATGKVVFRDFIEGETYVEEVAEGGKKMVVITEAKNRDLSPHIEIKTSDKDEFSGASILPVKATVVVKNNEDVKAGQVIVKIPKDVGKTRDITGGLPRIAELFEARNPSNPAVVTEIDGHVKYGKVKRGVRDIHVISKNSEQVYKIPYGKHILVYEGDLVFAGDRLCEGAVSPKDILRIKGSSKVQEYLVDQIQEVYKLQGVSINDKHIEVIVKQMMQKVSIEDPGDTNFLKDDRISKYKINKANDQIKQQVVISNEGDTDYAVGDVVLASNVKELNLEFKDAGKKPAKFTKAKPATFKPLLLGITRASLNTESFISAASFQETTRVLTDAAIEGKTDYLEGLKENVIIGRLIPAGTGLNSNKDISIKMTDSDIAEDQTVDQNSGSEEIATSDISS